MKERRTSKKTKRKKTKRKKKEKINTQKKNKNNYNVGRQEGKEKKAGRKEQKGERRRKKEKNTEKKENKKEISELKMKRRCKSRRLGNEKEVIKNHPTNINRKKKQKIYIIFKIIQEGKWTERILLLSSSISFITKTPIITFLIIIILLSRG